MLNSVLLEFATWLSEQAWSIGLHESFYMYNWIETTHVLTLMLSLGMLFIIDSAHAGRLRSPTCLRRSSPNDSTSRCSSASAS